VSTTDTSARPAVSTCGYSGDLSDRRAYLGAQNDAWFIIHGEAPALNNDHPRHDADRIAIAKVYDYEAGKRLVACWNACDGFPTEELEPSEYERNILKYCFEISRLTAQHDGLLAALQSARDVVQRAAASKLADGTYFDSDCSATLALTNIDAAIARAAAQTQQPTVAIPPEAAAIGAVLDGESLEQADAS